MDIDSRMANLETKFDEIRQQLTDYHEELLRNYYTKAEVNGKVAGVPSLSTDVELLKQTMQALQKTIEQTVAQAIAQNLRPDKKLDRQIIGEVILIILVLVSIIAQLTGTRVPGVQ